MTSTFIFYQVSFVYSGTDIAGISETVVKLQSGKYPNHPALMELLQQNNLQHAVQLINIIVEQVRPVENTTEGARFRKDFGLRILYDTTKVI